MKEEIKACGKIYFHNYSLRYRPGLGPSLKNINFEVTPCEKIGIIGRTVDRSSIEGKIVIDHIDISRIAVRQLRSNLNVIHQRPVLFRGTLRYNLGPFNYYSDEQLWVALEAVQIKPTIAESSNNLLPPVFQ
ncbi:unnamed protein product [Rotaria magnacalcarata]|uniref:Uncharacterized protein n=1 Tax=Rotaria magnacalcarata TaxID=392030 RepID=A0A816VZ75_9BILA|nr:unnamed protein product [Rotaria magnacalcarata]